MLFLSYLLYIVSAHDSLGRFWELVVLTIIGETMDESDNICGIVKGSRNASEIPETIKGKRRFKTGANKLT